jgi:hypothetical protein
VSAGTLEFDVGFQAINLAEDGAFLKLDSGFGEIGLRLAKVGHALFRIGAILGTFLLDLMAEVVKFGLRIAGKIDLLGAIEDGDEVAFLDFGSIGNQFGKSHGSPLAENLGDKNFGGADSFDSAGDADFAFATRSVGSGGMGNGRSWAGAGCQEQ